MGASMLLYLIPKCRLTAQRQRKLLRLVGRLPPDELDEVRDAIDLDDLEYTPEQLAAFVRPHLKSLEKAEDLREVTWSELPGMDYRALATGGVTWGDQPSEICASFALIEGSKTLFQQLLVWAREDWASEHRPSS